MNEEQAIAGVVSSALLHVEEVIVVDNGSTDATAEVAEKTGAKVVREPVSGYGRACLTGVNNAGAPDIYLFMDGDGADEPDDIPKMLSLIENETADFVIASRARGDLEEGALTLPQRWGNWLACKLMRWIWSGEYTDLGPFRAIRREAFDSLQMDALTYGWTVQMQARALKQKLKVAEIPTNYHRRIGTSKISGTLKGVVLAGYYILGCIAIEAVRGTSKRAAETSRMSSMV